LPGIRKSFPKLDLYLREDQTQSLYDELMRGGLDVILIALPYDLKNVQTQTLFEDHFLLAAHKKTRLLENPHDFRVNHMKRGEILLLEEGHCLRNHILSALKLKNQDRLNRFSATSLHTLIQMVDSDLGISFVPQMAEDSTLLKNTQVKLHKMSKTYVREIALVWRASSARGDEFGQLGELMKQLMQKK
ncbi:MAG: LysR substrate-binding domain-containing protein, partial [Gammaproteobacteria bacterium]|nr:LysR substrate-binding domain-containing protein [Gammaproteobacteria bacterium]